MCEQGERHGLFRFAVEVALVEGEDAAVAQLRAQHAHEGRILRAATAHEHLLDGLWQKATVRVGDAARCEGRRSRDDVLVRGALLDRTAARDEAVDVRRVEELAAGRLRRLGGEVWVTQQLVDDGIYRVACGGDLA